MKKILLAGALATCFGCIAYTPAPTGRPVPPPRPAPAPRPPAVSIDISYFHDALDPWGDWLYLRPYGWVWAPGRVDPFWRPYTVGRWVWTDWGWTWASQESWGWATYHYGRWVRAPRYGWVWIPDSTWGPAWVAWRNGPGLVGWAPLPPEARFRVGVGIEIGGIDIDLVIHQDWWCFVDEGRFVEPDVVRYAYPVGRNATVIHKTKDVTRYRSVDRRIVNEGIDRREVERFTRRAVPIRQIEDRGGDGDRRPEVSDRAIRVYRPEVKDAGRDTEPRRGRRVDDTPEPPSRPAPRPAPTPAPAPKVDRDFDKRWNEDWRKLEREQEKQQPKPDLDKVREENYRAAENARREYEAAQERAKRDAARPATPPGQQRKAVRKDDDKKDDKKDDKEKGRRR